MYIYSVQLRLQKKRLRRLVAPMARTAAVLIFVPITVAHAQTVGALEKAELRNNYFSIKIFKFL